MKTSVLTAVLLRDGTPQSKALELRKVAFVLCFSPGTQPPFMCCRVRSTHQGLKALSEMFDLAFPHLQSSGKTAQVRRVDEAEAEDPNVATVSGSDITQTTVFQICQLYWLTCWR